jgi:hypothetical protein
MFSKNKMKNKRSVTFSSALTKIEYSPNNSKKSKIIISEIKLPKNKCNKIKKIKDPKPQLHLSRTINAKLYSCGKFYIQQPNLLLNFPNKKWIAENDYFLKDVVKFYKFTSYKNSYIKKCSHVNNLIFVLNFHGLLRNISRLSNIYIYNFRYYIDKVNCTGKLIYKVVFDTYIDNYRNSKRIWILFAPVNGKYIPLKNKID